MVLAIIGLFAWFIPIFGLPITIIVLVIGNKELNVNKDDSVKVWIGLAILGLVLSIVNAHIGAYMGVTGQHPLVNMMQGK